MTDMLKGKRVGFAMCGSFCTFSKAFEAAQTLSSLGCELTPIMSFNAASISSRFGDAAAHISQIEEICGRKAILSIADAEPIGPKKLLDALVVCPCTGNTMAKLACGITDTPVTMAVKSHIRNGRPVLLALATNDALAASAKNIGFLQNCRHYYFVPYAQDDSENKPNSMIARFELLPEALCSALEGRQLQPVVRQI